ncbi:hypothetical protein [Blastococcus mobilis]|uniref:Uncharacterized protein n=1 Tax=Blastococcus mobilis TaxID=1938746 RepID=A0A238YZ78_9ACTN|nr:hypothetical protein [Blastococcus mobilis]SNR76302.1 hypothetical protein SAMN06272737_12372 [Blastococcus mobilis]
MGLAGAGFAIRVDAEVVLRRVVLLVVFVVVRLLVPRRGRPGMDLSLVPRHGKRPHRRNV